MSWLAPGVQFYYSDNESNNLKVSLTPLPAAFSFRSMDYDLREATSGDEPEQNTPFTEPGVQIRTSFDDWYYRIHVLPSRIALGNIAGDSAREIVVWNAYLSPATLESVDLTPDQGVDFSSGPAAPYTVGPLEELRYTLKVSVTGPSSLDATATWVIDGVAYEVPITGQRTVLFGFRPNWSTRVQETFEWRNTLTTTYSGYEQVMSTRTEPRRYLEYAFRLHQRDARMLDTALFGWTGRVFGLPWWPERTPLTQVAAAGASVLFLNTAGRSFAPNGAAVLYLSAVDYEMLDILEVLPDRLVLKNSLTRLWPASSRVYPVLPSIPGAEIATTRAVPSHIDGSVRFVVSPTDSTLNLPDMPPAALYRGEELYTGETNWRAPLGISVQSRRKDVDGQNGPIRIRRKSDAPLVVRGFSWLAKTRDDVWSLLALLARRKGRRVPLWMPSGAEDFKMVDDVLGGQNFIRVERSEHGRLIGTNDARRDVVLLLRDGTAIPRRVLAVEDEGRDSLVTFTDSFPLPIRRQDVKRVSYLGLYRLGADAFTLSWVTGAVAEVDVNLVLKKEREA